MKLLEVAFIPVFIYFLACIIYIICIEKRRKKIKDYEKYLEDEERFGGKDNE